MDGIDTLSDSARILKENGAFALDIQSTEGTKHFEMNMNL